MEEIESKIEELRAKRKSNLNVKEKPPKKDEGIFGVFTFQSILVLVLAILFVLSLTFFKKQTKEFTYEINNMFSNDFSFKEQLYDSVDSLFTYLNSISPINNEKETIGGTSSEETEESSSENEQNNTAEDELENENGVGGESTSIKNNEMPDHVTFAPVIYTGSVTYPIKKGKVTSTYGFRMNPILNELEFHTGLDIAAKEGTPILALADGVVVRSDDDVSLGNVIMIDHGNDFFTIYGHCSKLIAKEGMKIREGEVIARVGSTGISTGSHVHFSSKKDGLYFDPEYLFENKYYSFLKRDT